MTDRQRMMIASYLPSPPDPTLGFNEYYVRDTAGRVRKVRVVNVFPHDDCLEYDVYEVDTGRRIDSGWDDPWRGFRKGAMYDNREDCKHYEHEWYDGWEELRKLQEAEA